MSWLRAHNASAGLGMTPAQIEAMIAKAVEERASAKVAEVLAEERRKRKKRSKPERVNGDDSRRRRQRQSTESR
jgi:hypothetical protein